MPSASDASSLESVTREAGAATACDRGSCFWSSVKDSCPSAGLPGPQFRPPADRDGAEAGAARANEIYLALNKLQITATAAPNAPRPPDAKAFGFDLDGLCTGSTTCPDTHEVSCRPTAERPLTDDDDCRDNALSGLMAILRQIPDLADDLGLSESMFNCELSRGGYNILVRITDYNGTADDPSVRVDWYTSSGLETEPDWLCPSDLQSHARWTRNARFGVDARELAAAITDQGHLPASRVSDASAFVRNGYLVSRIPDGAQLRLAGNAKPLRGLSMLVQKAYWVGRLAKSEDDAWTMSDGMFAGRVRVEDLFQSLRQAGFCKQSPADTLFESIKMYVESSADVLASGQNDPELSCDALSFGIAFNAQEVTPGGAARPLEPLLECCQPGVSALDCQPQCGDAVMSGNERCDTAITEGPGACPTRCVAQTACDPVTLEGVGCQAHCVKHSVTKAQPGDGCCPVGATAATDSDCKTDCGNGVVEPGETCDFKSGCPVCESADRCMLVTSKGSAATCDLECSVKLVTACRSGDGCCPTGCRRDTDSDCSASCGDGKVDSSAFETCEPGSATPCATSCDDKNGCTRDEMTGSPDTCNVQCSHWQITALTAGDGCCPDGATSDGDPDCDPDCGNSIKEKGEDCDDGNLADGDGCSRSCRNETPSDLCQMRVAQKQANFNDACVQCVCGSCTTQANGCYSAPNERDVDLCNDIVECVRENGCSGTACYCGGDLLACSLGYPAGPCRSQIERAAGTSSLSRLSTLSRAADNPFGRASLFGECAYQSCAQACGLTAK
jgi:cysteine-rich repeat protein